LGDCIGECPRDAITIVEREGAAYDQAAVDAHLARVAVEKQQPPRPESCACPGAAIQTFESQAEPGGDAADRPSRLAQWPVLLNRPSNLRPNLAVTPPTGLRVSHSGRFS
jgi:ferredoxin